MVSIVQQYNDAVNKAYEDLRMAREHLYESMISGIRELIRTGYPHQIMLWGTRLGTDPDAYCWNLDEGKLLQFHKSFHKSGRETITTDLDVDVESDDSRRFRDYLHRTPDVILYANKIDHALQSWITH